MSSTLRSRFSLMSFRLGASLLGLSLVCACSAADELDDASQLATGGQGMNPGSGGGDLGATGGATGQGTGGGQASGGAPASGGNDGTGGLEPLEECVTASIDRFQQWNASGEGPTIPATGTLLVEG